MLSCPICQIQFNWEAKLNKHIEKIHSIEPEIAYIKNVLSGVLPVCQCGKGDCSRPTWYGWIKGHNKFVKGHNAVIPHSKAAYDKAAAKRVDGFAAGK